MSNDSAVDQPSKHTNTQMTERSIYLVTIPLSLVNVHPIVTLYRLQWGGFEDALCLASIYRIRFSIITVQSCVNKSLMNHQVMTGRKKDGRRLFHPCDLECVLIYFNNEAHYGVGVPI